MLNTKIQSVCFQNVLIMEFLFPTISLNGPVWPALFCPGEYAELVSWVEQARGPILGLGYVMEVDWDPRFLRILEILTGTSDVSIIIFCFVSRLCIIFLIVELMSCLSELRMWEPKLSCECCVLVSCSSC